MVDQIYADSTPRPAAGSFLHVT
uniref:Uncharacterized protein n=1 Tax=Rhizophora mucronata TaxID=61149 RepID=A0A2P2QS83_RHIMU